MEWRKHNSLKPKDAASGIILNCIHVYIINEEAEDDEEGETPIRDYQEKIKKKEEKEKQKEEETKEKKRKRKKVEKWKTKREGCWDWEEKRQEWGQHSKEERGYSYWIQGGSLSIGTLLER